MDKIRQVVFRVNLVMITITKSKTISREFGKKLKELRIQKKMSQGDIARALGVHRSYISGLERGIRNPTLTNIERLAKALKVEPSKLLETK